MIIRYKEMRNRINKLEMIVRGISYAKVDSHWNYGYNKVGYNEIYFVRSGEASLWVNGEETRLVPGRVYIIPANCLCASCCEKCMEKFYINVSVLNEYKIDIFSRLDRIISVEYPVDKIDKLRKIAESDSAADVFIMQSELMYVISRLVDSAVNDHNMKADFDINPKYAPIIDYINRNISIELRVSDIADEFGYSIDGFSKGFKHEIGLSVKKYINQQILNIASYKLRFTDIPIGEIAEQLGFEDRFYFSRFFRNNMKISPSEYRVLNAVRYKT